MTPTVLDQVVLGKLHFRADDLLLAIDGNQLLGFLHLARPLPGPTGEDPGPAALNMLLVDPDCDQPADVADRLLHAGLERGGGELCTAHPCQKNLFYTGLYGGTCFPGFLESDSIVIQALVRSGFQVTHRRGVYRAPASRVSFPVDHATRQLRRTSKPTTLPLLMEVDWREANERSHLQRTLIRLESSPGGDLLGQLETWDPSPLADGWKGPAIGIHRLQSGSNQNSDVIFRALLAEAISFIQRTPAQYVEIHDDLLAASELEELGFELVDQALEMEFRPG